MTLQVSPIASSETLALAAYMVARRITRLRRPADILMVTLAEGGRPWTRDLEINLVKTTGHKPQSVEIVAKSYEGTESTGKVSMHVSTETKSVLNAALLGRRDIMVVDDIVDTGTTAQAVMDYLMSLGFDEERLLMSSMLVRTAETVGRSIFMVDEMIFVTNHDLPLYAGLYISNDIFVVGHGLDHDGQFRELDHLGSLVDIVDG